MIFMYEHKIKNKRFSNFKQNKEATLFPSSSHENATIFPSSSHAKNATILPSPSHAKCASILPSISLEGDAATLPSTSHAQGAETSLLFKSKIRIVKIFKALLEIPMAENTRITEFRDVTPSCLLGWYERFVGNRCLLLQCASGHRRHPLSVQHATASSEPFFICKSSLLPFSGTPSVISSPFSAKIYN